MQKFKFGNPASVVEVSKSPLDRPVFIIFVAQSFT